MKGTAVCLKWISFRLSSDTILTGSQPGGFAIPLDSIRPHPPLPEEPLSITWQAQSDPAASLTADEQPTMIQGVFTVWVNGPEERYADLMKIADRVYQRLSQDRAAQPWADPDGDGTLLSSTRLRDLAPMAESDDRARRFIRLGAMYRMRAAPTP